MKKLLFILVFLPFVGFGQNVTLPVDSETQRVSFVSIVDVENTSQAELYSRAKIWFVNNFKDANEVIQLDDKENGLIMGKGNFNINYGFMGVPIISPVFFTVSIRVKDNRFKAEITDMKVRSEPSQFQPTAIDTPVEMYNTEKSNKNKTIQKIIVSTIEKSEATLLSIKKSMTTTSVSSKDF